VQMNMSQLMFWYVYYTINATQPRTRRQDSP
jgi:hypothetical protein